MTILQRAPLPKRAMLGALAALLLALRLLSPAGFMPAFDRGSVTIVACPDADGPTSHAASHHHGPATAHQSCPYAAASAPGFVGGHVAPFVALLFAGMVLAPAVALTGAARQSRHLRPFLRGPPLPA